MPNEDAYKTNMIIIIIDVGFPSLSHVYHWLIKKLGWPDRVE